jgi:hypothetical protein
MKKKELKKELKAARKKNEDLKLMRAEDRQIYDLLLKHQVKSG